MDMREQALHKHRFRADKDGRWCSCGLHEAYLPWANEVATLLREAQERHMELHRAMSQSREIVFSKPVQQELVRRVLDKAGL
jgi:hypothetical protein